MIVFSPAGSNAGKKETVCGVADRGAAGTVAVALIALNRLNPAARYRLLPPRRRLRACSVEGGARGSGPPRATGPEERR
jgi:hypothetical protein